MARSKLELFKPKNVTGHKFYALLFAVIMVLGVVLFAGLMQAAGSNSTSLTGHQSITSMVSQVWGWNGTTWDAAVLTLTPGSYQVAAAFPAQFAPQTVIVVTANTSYDAMNLLSNSYLYTSSKITLTATAGASSKLNSAYEYVGIFQNSTATSALGDKAITKSVLNQTLYAGSVNNLGLPVEYNILQLFNTLPHSMPLYQIYLQSSANKTGAITVTFVNYLTSPFSFNLITLYSETILVVFGASVVVTIAFQHPRHRGG